MIFDSPDLYCPVDATNLESGYIFKEIGRRIGLPTQVNVVHACYILGVPELLPPHFKLKQIIEVAN